MDRFGNNSFIKHAKKGFNYLFRAGLIITVFLAVINIFISSISQGFSQQNNNLAKTYQQEKNELYQSIIDAKKSSHATERIAGYFFAKTTCSAIGEGCTDNPNESDKYYSKSLLGQASGIMFLPFISPPSSFTYYAYSTISNFGFVPQAYAADGVGFSSLNALSGIWKTFRDIAYFIVVVAIMFVGFLIMFRRKINPQTVMSIENSIPRLILTLVYVTFSFAIVGLFVDLMYVMIGIIISFMANFTGSNVAQLSDQYMTAGPGGIWSLLNRGKSWNIAPFISLPVDHDILWTLPNALFTLMPTLGLLVKYIATGIGVMRGFGWIWDNIFKPIAGLIDIDLGLSVGAAATLDGFLSAVTTFAIKPTLLVMTIFIFAHFIVPFVIGLIILFTVITLFFRILFMLFKSYIILLLMTIFSPIILLEEVIPGRSAFSNWLRTIIAELISFPTLILLLFAGAITINAATSGSLLQLPFLYGIDPKSFSIVIGIILLFMMPTFVKKVKEKIQPKPMSIGAGPGILFAGGVGAIGAISGIAPGVKSAFLDKLIRPIVPKGLRETLIGKNAAQQADAQRNIYIEALQDYHGIPPASPRPPASP